MKYLDEPHYYPTNIQLDIDLDYVKQFINGLTESDWKNHVSTKSKKPTEIWYVPICRPETYKNLPPTHSAYSYPKVIPAWDPTQLSKLMRLDYSMLILRIGANDHLKPHTDGISNPRRTVWSFPLSGEYASVKFYDNFDEPAVAEYSGQMLLNTANIHEVDNGAEVRYNLQICFEDDIETVYNAHKDLIEQ